MCSLVVFSMSALVAGLEVMDFAAEACSEEARGRAAPAVHSVPFQCLQLVSQLVGWCCWDLLSLQTTVVTALISAADQAEGLARQSAVV